MILQNSFQFSNLIAEDGGGFEVKRFHGFIHLGFLSTDEFLFVLAEDFFVEQKIGANGAVVIAFDRVGDIVNFFAHRFRCNAMLHIVGELDVAATVRFIDCTLE